MTETRRPTPEDFARAMHEVTTFVKHDADGYRVRHINLARCHLALAAEKEALEERVRHLEAAIKSVLPGSQVTIEAHAWLVSALAADDAKAAGSGAAEALQGMRDAIQAVRDGTVRAEYRAEHMHHEGVRSHSCDGGANCPDAKAAGEPEELHKIEWRPDPGDRASRRLAYVREKAPGLLEAALRGGQFAATVDRAIEQAGLIFDETEQSE